MNAEIAMYCAHL